ncbi:uncharacterized protein DDB_G0283357-like [Portunus trituberculatus]|uniref:uncharacterized protein DDB_G0283357-like n=1 Tax=Portunus trituberculatus TaxID=210409 RepID=UPI001E1CEA23|nr:uncharacterized protein DDB_G0283357-like [Portunus trituberculatus]
MKLRYDFDSSQKTYRTFPQRMVQSTGLADRWSFLKWCCPFCLDKPKARSRTSSGVPVIRITRPRSPDSDIESDEELEWQRNSGRNTDSTVQSPRDNGWNEPGGDAGSVTSSIGSGELENIDEEHKYYREDDNDRDSVWSKSSIRSKDSIKSKASVTDSLKSKSSQKNKRNKDSKKNSKGSRDSIVDKDSNKTRSPMKKIFKQLKRTTSSGSTSSADSRGDDHTPLKSVSRRDDGRKGGAKRPVSAFDGKWRSMTMSNSRTQDKEIQRSSFSEYRSQTMKTSARGAHDAQERDDEVFFSDSRGHHTSSGGREPKEAPGSPNSRPRKYHAHEGNKAEVRDGKINSGSKNSEKNVDRNSISSATPAESTEKESLRALAKCEPPENGDREMEHNPWPGSHEIQLSSAKIVLPKKQHQHHQQQQDPKEQQRQQQQHLQQQQEQHQQHQQKQKQQAYQEHPTPSTTPSPQHSSPSPLEACPPRPPALPARPPPPHAAACRACPALPALTSSGLRHPRRRHAPSSTERIRP